MEFKTFKSLAEFKKNISVGGKLKTIFHKDIAGFDENGKAIYRDKDMGIREISVKQSNSFACKNLATGDNSWLQYPKASEVKIVDNNTLEIYHKDMRHFKGIIAEVGNPDYDNLPDVKVLTYQIVEKE